MHHERTQETAKFNEILTREFANLAVFAVIVIIGIGLAGGDLVIDEVEAFGDGDDDGGYREGVEKR